MRAPLLLPTMMLELLREVWYLNWLYQSPPITTTTTTTTANSKQQTANNKQRGRCRRLWRIRSHHYNPRPFIQRSTPSSMTEDEWGDGTACRKVGKRRDHVKENWVRWLSWMRMWRSWQLLMMLVRDERRGRGEERVVLYWNRQCRWINWGWCCSIGISSFSLGLWPNLNNNDRLYIILICVSWYVLMH